jgi:hypothetical protein
LACTPPAFFLFDLAAPLKVNACKLKRARG